MSTFEPDTWPEEEWTRRLSLVCERGAAVGGPWPESESESESEIDPMRVADLVVSGDITIDDDGTVIPLSERAKLVVDVLLVQDALDRGEAL